MTREEILKQALVEINEPNIHKNVVERWAQFKREPSTKAILNGMELYKDQELLELSEKYEKLQQDYEALQSDKDPYRDLGVYDSLDAVNKKYNELEESYRQSLTSTTEKYNKLKGAFEWLLTEHRFTLGFTEYDANQLEIRAGLKED